MVCENPGGPWPPSAPSCRRPCPASKPPLSRSKTATLIFLLHLKRKHPAEATEFQKSKKARQDDYQKTPKTTQKTLLQFCLQACYN